MTKVPKPPQPMNHVLFFHTIILSTHLQDYHSSDKFKTPPIYAQLLSFALYFLTPTLSPPCMPIVSFIVHSSPSTGHIETSSTLKNTPTYKTSDDPSKPIW